MAIAGWYGGFLLKVPLVSAERGLKAGYFRRVFLRALPDAGDGYARDEGATRDGGASGCRLLDLSHDETY